MTASAETNRNETNELSLETFKTRVDSIHIDGIQRTKDDILVSTVKQLFDATNFEEVVLRAHTVKRQLESLGAFKSIEVMIDTSSGEHASEDGLDVTYSVTENRRVIGGVNTSIGNNNDGSVVLQMKLPNALGRGELLQSEYQYGTKHTTGFHVSFMKPLVPWLWPQPKLTATVLQHASDAPWSGFREIDRGLLLDLAFKSRPTIYHSLRWEGIWREISALGPSTAFAVREECGHSLKSCIKHILTRDNRDNTVLPSTGSLFRLQQEYAGFLGGNVGFHKHEIEIQHNIPLFYFNNIIIQTGVRAGIMRASQKMDSVTCINDRFFLGGPLTLRGFQMYGIGPHSEGNALGANTYWTTGLHIYTPLPFIRSGGFSEYFRTHLFLNAGNIGEFNFSDDHYKNLNILLNRLRYSAGIGLVLSIGHIARFELNYCIPWGQQPGDKPNQGLQFGIGINFI